MDKKKWAQKVGVQTKKNQDYVNIEIPSKTPLLQTPKKIDQITSSTDLKKITEKKLCEIF